MASGPASRSNAVLSSLLGSHPPINPPHAKTVDAKAGAKAEEFADEVLAKTSTAAAVQAAISRLKAGVEKAYCQPAAGLPVFIRQLRGLGVLARVLG